MLKLRLFYDVFLHPFVWRGLTGHAMAQYNEYP